MEEPGYDECEHHAGEKEVEEPVALPEPPRLVGRRLRGPGVARFVPLLDELRVAETYHVARSGAADFADPNRGETCFSFQERVSLYDSSSMVLNPYQMTN